MATGADAGIVSGTPNVTIKTPANRLAGFGGNSASTVQAATFGLGGADIFLQNASETHSHTYRSVGAGVGGLKVFFQTFAPHRSRATALTNGFALKFNSGQSITGGFGKIPNGVLRRGFGRFFGPGTDNNARSVRGRFGINTTGIVGFTVFGGDLGWMKIKIGDQNSDGYPDQLTILSYAYNTTPGAPITAGEAPASSPEPGTAALGLLAAGAAGILALRRRKEAQSN